MTFLLLGGIGTPEIIIIVLFLFFAVFVVGSILSNSNFNLPTKLLWIIIVLVAPFLGAVLYLAWGRYQKSGSL